MLRGTLLTGIESFNWLKNAINSSPQDCVLHLASAYLKSPVVKKLLNFAEGRKGRFLVRWKKQDLVSGSSDLEAFSLLSAAGWKLYIDCRFHGKVYVVPGSGILLGSANATSSGFSLDMTGNKETCAVIAESEVSGSFISQLFNDAVILDNNLFEKMREELELSDQNSKNQLDSDWSSKILLELSNSNVSNLFCHDLFQQPPCKDFSANNTMDKLLVGWSETKILTPADIQKQISNLKITHFIRSLCQDNTDGIRFGELTAKIHNLLIDDPMPYRSTVKQLVSATLQWISVYCSNQFVVERPNHSEIIRLKI